MQKCNFTITDEEHGFAHQSKTAKAASKSVHLRPCVISNNKILPTTVELPRRSVVPLTVESSVRMPDNLRRTQIVGIDVPCYMVSGTISKHLSSPSSSQ